MATGFKIFKDITMFRTQKFLHFKEFPLFIACAVFSTLLTSFVMGFETLREGDYMYFFLRTLASFLTGSFIWYISRFIYFFWLLRYPSQQYLVKRYIVLFPSLVLFMSLLYALAIYTARPEGIDSIADVFTSGMIKDYILDALFLILLYSVYEILYFYYGLQIKLLERERLEKENIRTQLSALQSQISPHFLFNNLNTLTYLIRHEPDTSIEFVEQLSFIYEYVLRVEGHEFVTVNEELKYLQAYSYLLKKRFGNNFQIDLEVSDRVKDEYVVPLSMQVTVENAVKHNKISAITPLKIKVYDEENILYIQNNLEPKKNSGKGFGIGLENLTQRYSLLLNRSPFIYADADFFRVGVPLTSKNINHYD